MKILLTMILLSASIANAYVYCANDKTGAKTWFGSWECPKGFSKTTKERK